MRTKSRLVYILIDVFALRCEKFQTERIRRFEKAIYTILVEETLKAIAAHPRLSELNICSRNFSCQSKHYLRVKRINHFASLKRGAGLGVLEGGNLKDDRRRTENSEYPDSGLNNLQSS